MKVYLLIFQNKFLIVLLYTTNTILYKKRTIAKRLIKIKTFREKFFHYHLKISKLVASYKNDKAMIKYKYHKNRQSYRLYWR